MFLLIYITMNIKLKLM